MDEQKTCLQLMRGWQTLTSLASANECIANKCRCAMVDSELVKVIVRVPGSTTFSERVFPVAQVLGC